MGKLNVGEESSRDSTRKRFRIKNLFYVYKTVARIVSGALKQEGTLRSLVYEHSTTLVKTHLNLSIEVIRHRHLLEKLLSQTGIVEKEDLEPELAQVLVYELLLGEAKQLQEGVEVFDVVTSYRNQLEEALKEIRDSGEFDRLVLDKPEATIPRYGRVNTLLTTLESVIESLQKNGYKLLDTKGYAYAEFLDCVRSLGYKEFVLDFHFPQDLLVFYPKQYLGKLFVHRAGHLVIHDKTSYFPVACLNAPPGSTVLDACAAPGMKTIHIASKMQNQGTLLALDMNATALEKLEENLNLFGVQCCTATITNFLSVDPLSDPFNRVEYLLLDVPCSYTGNNSNYQEVVLGVHRNYPPERLKPLCALQFKMLSHAMKFPNVKRIVYTTASIDEHEDERIVKDALKRNADVFKVVKSLPEWHLRGKAEYSFGDFCFRSLPIEDLTRGAFVAVLERIEGGGQFEDQPQSSHKRRDESERVKRVKPKTLEKGQDDRGEQLKSRRQEIESTISPKVENKRLQKKSSRAEQRNKLDSTKTEDDASTPGQNKRKRTKSFENEVSEMEGLSNSDVKASTKKSRKKYVEEIEEIETLDLVNSTQKKRKKMKSESGALDPCGSPEVNVQTMKQVKSKMDVEKLDQSSGPEQGSKDKRKKQALEYNDFAFDIFSPQTKR